MTTARTNEIDMHSRFYELADALTARLRGEEVLLMNLTGEVSDFVRFNGGLVRQPGTVAQAYMSMELIDGLRHTSAAITIGGDGDEQRCSAALEQLRQQLPALPEDPYLMYSREVASSDSPASTPPLDGPAIAEAILDAAGGRDLVGLLASGDIHRGFANSLGQRNWFEARSFHFGWSIYHHGDKAVKNSYAGFEFSPQRLTEMLGEADRQLEVLARPAKTIPPGRYRVYLAPAALAGLVEMMGSGGFSCKAHRTRTSPLMRMTAEGEALNPAVTLTENTAEGIAPNFTSQGYLKPPAVALIEAGRYRNSLISPRSAREFGLQPNSGGEAPSSLDLAAGDLADEDILGQLDTGVHVSQTHYLNYSDRPAARITGLTRFATFWVEGGRIVAPLNVMRFDETIFDVLGAKLVALTARRELRPSSASYQQRSTSSIRLGGALVRDFTFTL